ncbi:hypothetical protein KY361_03080 [Candidatus Woesearchaeota archaeon]|nr:hypothetical protein [Candidatus Woesearchaeota archaeon]
MKCEFCGKELERKDYIAMLKMFRIAYRAVSLFLLPRWLITGKLYKNLDEKLEYAHKSCYDKVPFNKQLSWKPLMSSIDNPFLFIIIVLIFFIFFFIGVPIMSECSSNPFPACLEGVKSSLSYLLIFITILFLWTALPLYLAQKYIKNKLKF